MGPAAPNVVLVLLLRAFLCISASAEQCSSLDGPFCGFLNGKEPAFHMQMKEGMQPTRFETDHPAEFEETAGGKVSTSGSFAISGDLDLESGMLTLMPGEWIKQPSNWVTIGLTGQMTEDNFSGGIINDEGEKMDMCSGFSADRVVAGAGTNPGGTETSSSPTLSVWKGHYVCLDFSTAMTVRLENNADDPLHFRGVFEFAAMKSDDSDEWEEEIDTSSMQVLQFPQKTRGGCTCMLGWLNEETTHRFGECEVPKDVNSAAPWCEIDQRIPCESDPAGKTWDVCQDTMVGITQVIDVVAELLEEVDMENIGQIQFVLLYDDKELLIMIDLEDPPAA